MGVFFGGCPPLTWKLLCRANDLTKSEAGLHLSWKRAKGNALPRIKLCWTGRDRAIRHPLDNPPKKTPTVLSCCYYFETLNIKATTLRFDDGNLFPNGRPIGLFFSSSVGSILSYFVIQFANEYVVGPLNQIKCYPKRHGPFLFY